MTGTCGIESLFEVESLASSSNNPYMGGRYNKVLPQRWVSLVSMPPGGGNSTWRLGAQLHGVSALTSPLGTGLETLG
ncbi:TPA: hypothetical protein EYP27_04575 [Candidatus Bathyarchaeota archaeon]|nr:hypothetical protein [Candidatus Bathyarchaeota archaeon]